MASSEYLDCELYLIGEDQARLSVAGRDYAGRPALDEALRHQLHKTTLDPARYGTLLFEALFPDDGGDLLAGYRDGLAIARHEGKRLCLRLHIASSAPLELHDLFWELLYDPKKRIALGRSQDTAFSRYLSVPLEPGTAVVTRPKMLVVLSNPEDLADYGLPGIDQDAMRDLFDQTSSPLRELVDCELLEGPATLGRLRDRLVMGKFQLLHVQAHGTVDSAKAVANLVLEDEDRRACFIDEDLLSEIVEGDRHLRLLTLIACHGGAPARADPFSGLGPALLRRGIPAVVAMRRAIRVDAAARFTEHLYRNLACSGRIDTAANEARQQLHLADPDCSDWGTPALFMRLSEGLLWQPDHQMAADGPCRRAAPGRTFLHYRILEPLGTGGRGEVFVAEDTKLDRKVAFKVLPADVASDPPRLKRFEREARILAALNHPNIVTIHSVEEAGGVRFLTTEWVQGKSLTSIIPEAGLTTARFLRLAVPLTDALSAAHQRGIIHRDLQPENVMVSDEGRVKVLDFGLAKLDDPKLIAERDSSETTGLDRREVAALIYTSPEQLQAQRIDHRADIFSLGIVLYEMLTGRHPFQGKAPVDIISSILRGKPRPLTELRDDLPRDLSRIVRRCLRKDPGQRYQRAKDVRNELRKLAKTVGHGSPVSGGDSAATLSPVINPFRGLEVFREEDQELFFGREAVVQGLIEHLRSQRSLAVLGPSGCGKSSVVQAGLIPRLRRDKSLIALFTPREQPLEELAFALRSVYSRIGKDRPTEQLIGRLNETEHALHFISRELVADAEAEHLVIVVDQFEELFTQTSSEEERQRFLKALLAADVPAPSMFLILTMRSDFVGKCAFCPALNTFMNDHFVQIGPMCNDELRRAIEEPARIAGLRFEEGLVDRILSDVAGAPGELPLLEHALLELFERRAGTRMTLRAYEETGGVDGALANRADMEFGKLDTSQRQTLRRMFVLRLVRPGEGTEDTRRRATREELLAAGKQPDVAETLIERWTRARLLTTQRDPSRGRDLVDVSHEALIRKWSRIRTWMEEDREASRLIGQLRQAAEDWHRSKSVSGQSGYLLRGRRLVEIEKLCETHADDLTALEKSFIRMSIECRDQEAKAKENQRQRELQATQELATANKKALRRLRRILVFTAIFLLALVAMGFLMRRIANEAERTRQAASRARNVALIAVASEWVDKNPIIAALVLLEVENPEEAAAAVPRTFEALSRELAIPELEGGIPGREPAELIVAIRAATKACLDPGFREENLGELPEEARQRYQECERSHGR